MKCYLFAGLMYDCELFASCDSVSKENFNIHFNNIVRYVYSLRRYDHVSCFSLKLYGVSLDNLLCIRVLLSLYKIIYSEFPGYFSDKIRFVRTLKGKIIMILLYHYHVSEWHFFIHAVRLWNCFAHSGQLNIVLVSHLLYSLEKFDLQMLFMNTTFLLIFKCKIKSCCTGIENK